MNTTSQQANTAPLEKSYDLVVSLGTDHHQFDRLITWVEDFLAANPQVTCLFQHGFTRQPVGADAVERLPRPELLKHYEQAKVVLVQGGPGSILDAREVGVIPFSVPRLKKYDEVVDDHQVQFSEIMESHGETIVIRDAADLNRKLTEALAHPERVHGSRRVSDCDTAAINLKEAMAHLQGYSLPHRGHFIRRCRQVAKSILARG